LAWLLGEDGLSEKETGEVRNMCIGQVVYGWLKHRVSDNYQSTIYSFSETFLLLDILRGEGCG
jgi:hypothetical protein